MRPDPPLAPNGSPAAGAPQLLTVTEAARLLRCSGSTVRREITAGRLGAVRLGRRGMYRIPMDALRSFAAASGVHADPRVGPDPTTPSI